MSEDPKTNPNPSPAGCMLNMLWLFGGSVGLAFSAIYVVLNRHAHLSPADIVFAAFLIGSIAIRYVEIRFFEGKTTDGRRATMADLGRYALKLCLIGGAGLAVAHLLATLL